MAKKYGPYLLLFGFVSLFFWQFVFRGRIPIDSSPLYQMRPWSALPYSQELTHPVDPARYYHNIDPVIEIFPVKKWLSGWLQKGDFPLWNPDNFSGTPFAANHHAAPWDISTILFFLLPTDLAFGLTLLLQLFAAGASLYFYCRTLEISRTASVFGALGFMLNGFFLHWLGLISFNAGLIWMPLIPAGIELMLRKQDWKYIFISSAGFGLSFLSGMAQFWLFNFFLFVTYGAYRTYVHSRERKIGLFTQSRWLALALLLALGFGAVQIFQTVGSLRHTSRGGSAAQASLYSGRNHLSPRKLPTLAIPDLYSRTEENVFSKLLLSPPEPEAKGFWGKLIWGEKGFVLNRSWGYIGILGFCFMILGFLVPGSVYRFHRWMIFLILSFQVLLCFKAFHVLCLKLWPGFDTLDHTRTIALYIFSASVLAAAGLDHISELRTRMKWLGRVLAAGIIVLLLLVMGLHIAPALLGVAERIQQLAGTNTNPDFAKEFFLDAAQKITTGFHQSAEILYAPLILLTGLFLALRMWLRNAGTLRRFQFVIIVLALADLLYHGWTDPILVYTDRKALYPQTSKTVEFLKQDPEQFRVYELQRKKPLPSTPLKDYSLLEHFRKGSIRFFDFRSVDFVFRPNTLLAYGIPSAGGYLSLYPGRYKKLWEGRGMDVLKAIKPGQSIQEWNAPWIGMQNIKYIAVPEEIDTGNWRPVYRGEGVQLLKLDSFCPAINVVRTALVIPDPQELLETLKSSSFQPLDQVLLEEPLPNGMIPSLQVPYSLLMQNRTPDLLRLQVELQQDGYLVIAENLIPGWRAVVNGTEERLWRANFAFMCLPLKRGRYDISLEYVPTFYGWSLFLTVVSAIIIVLPGIVQWIKKSRKNPIRP